MYDKFPEDVKSFYMKYRDTNGFVLDEINKMKAKSEVDKLEENVHTKVIISQLEKKIDKLEKELDSLRGK